MYCNLFLSIISQLICIILIKVYLCAYCKTNKNNNFVKKKSVLKKILLYVYYLLPNIISYNQFTFNVFCHTWLVCIEVVLL